MFLFKTAEELQKYVRRAKQSGKTIGFVPTMGALHEGHLSLMNMAAAHSDVVVCSIFVNPTQFNDPGDLKNYPRTISQDMKALYEEGVNVLFFPSVTEVYPEDIDPDLQIDLAGLDKVLEGAHRPGHFNGVVQVVKRLLDIVEPQVLVMGQKDFQQFAIVRRMLEVLKWTDRIQLIQGRTLREPHGLAYSSRNERLSTAARERAAVLYESLQTAKENYGQIPIHEIKEKCQKKIRTNGFDKIEYFEIVHCDTLSPIHEKTKGVCSVAVVAAWIDGVRLIDNLTLSGDS